MENSVTSRDENNQHFAGKYFEEIDEISETDNYFIPVLRDVGLQIDFKYAHVLDVGCGTGLFLKPLIAAGCENCYGVDGHTEFADRAIARGYKEVSVVGDLSNDRIPYADAIFDLVICKDVFEHLLNPIHTLSEIRRVLTAEGLLLLHVPNHFPLIGRLKFLFTNNIDTFSFFRNESRWTFPHVRFYEYQDSLRVLHINQFTLVSNLSHHFQALPLLNRFKTLRSFRRWLVTRFPDQFAAGFTLLLKKTD